MKAIAEAQRDRVTDRQALEARALAAFFKQGQALPERAVPSDLLSSNWSPSPPILPVQGYWVGPPASFTIPPSAEHARRARKARYSNPAMEAADRCVQFGLKRCDQDGDLRSCDQAFRYARSRRERAKYKAMVKAIRVRLCRGNMVAEVAGDPAVCRTLASEAEDPGVAGEYMASAVNAQKDREELARKRARDAKYQAEMAEREERIRQAQEDLSAQIEAERQRRLQIAAAQKAAAAQQDDGGISFGSLLLAGAGAAVIGATDLPTADKVELGTAWVTDVVNDTGGTGMQQLMKKKEATARSTPPPAGAGASGGVRPAPSSEHFGASTAGGPAEALYGAGSAGGVQRRAERREAVQEARHEAAWPVPLRPGRRAGARLRLRPYEERQVQVPHQGPGVLRARASSSLQTRERIRQALAGEVTGQLNSLIGKAERGTLAKHLGGAAGVGHDLRGLIRQARGARETLRGIQGPAAAVTDAALRKALRAVQAVETKRARMCNR